MTLKCVKIKPLKCPKQAYKIHLKVKWKSDTKNRDT